MKLTNKKLVLEIMERIELIQQHIKNLEQAASYAVSRRRYENVDYGNLRNALVDEELHEWRNLFMWGLTLDKEEQERIKAAAFQRFLRDGMHVANWLNDGVSPSSWLVEEEQEFRKMAKKVFGPAEE
jgi:hypothetical protein